MSLQWIPVSERLPESQVDVLACDEYKNLAVCRNAGGTWITMDMDINEEAITHWADVTLPEGEQE